MSLFRPLARSPRAGRAFGAATSGSVMPAFALMMTAAAMVTGGAVDYAQMQNVREKLNAAADAAALSATSKQALTSSAATAQTQAAAIFTKFLTTDAAAAVTTSAATVTDANSARTSTFTYTAKIKPAIFGGVGLPAYNLQHTSTSTASLPVYVDFYLLLDNTPSMGVAATTAGIDKMVANTPDQCAFACHDMSASPNDYYGLAKKLGVTLRIDVVRAATQQLMDRAAAAQVVSNQYRAAIYTFGSSASAAGLTAVQSLTTSLSGAKTSAAAIDLMTVPYQNYNSDMDTDFDGVLSSMNTAIPTPGTGASASATPQKVLFFVSDGVADANYPWTCSQPVYAGYRCEEPLTTSICTSIKSRGIRIAVLYTTYLPLPTNGWYNSQIAPFASQISQRMQACASPGLYFEVSPSQGIADAMNALFDKAVKTARLTN